MTRRPRLARLALPVLVTVAGCGGVSRQQFDARQQQKLAELTTRPAALLTDPRPMPEVQALCDPPAGWRSDPQDNDDRHTHLAWVSPTGRTAYGVIHFKLPLPVGASIVHWRFIEEMRKSEGEAIDGGSSWDEKLPGMRFVVDGGQYRLRANLIVQGFEGWTIYAGTLRKQPVDEAELKIAESARERTIPGLAQAGAAPATRETGH